MPYIEQKERSDWMQSAGLEKLLSYIKRTTPPGVLNFIMTKILLKALEQNPNYTRFNEIIGVLECCKQEIYRREVALYEDQKIEENGDVY